MNILKNHNHDNPYWGRDWNPDLPIIQQECYPPDDGKIQENCDLYRGNQFPGGQSKPGPPKYKVIITRKTETSRTARGSTMYDPLFFAELYRKRNFYRGYTNGFPMYYLKSLVQP